MAGTQYRDSTGRTLSDYPRPSVAVDTALLAPDPDDGLVVLQVKRPGSQRWALPGSFLHQGERLADAVNRSLEVKAGVSGIHPHQLGVFDDPNRDERGWVLSVAYWAVVPLEQLDARLIEQTRLMPVEKCGRLIYDHRLIISEAVDRIRSEYRDRPDPEHLLGAEFTVLQLRLLHQTIAGGKFDRDWFRRTMKDKLVPTGMVTDGTRGRPAELFQRVIVDTAGNARRW